MSLFSKLFGKKQTPAKPVEKVQVGTEITRPEPITAKMSTFYDDLPEWFGDESRWGYGKDDAFVMACENSNEGIHNEYVFAEFRSKVEVDASLNMVYAGLEREDQSLVNDKTNQYDVIRFKVYLFTNEDWDFLREDYESHNRYQGDPEGMKHHAQLRNERVKYYESECWININRFYGEW